MNFESEVVYISRGFDIAMTSNICGHMMPNRDRSQANLLHETFLDPSAPNAHPEKTKAVTLKDYSL